MLPCHWASATQCVSSCIQTRLTSTSLNRPSWFWAEILQLTFQFGLHHLGRLPVTWTHLFTCCAVSVTGKQMAAVKHWDLVRLRIKPGYLLFLFVHLFIYLFLEGCRTSSVSGPPVIIPINSVSASCENVISRRRALVAGGAVLGGGLSWSGEHHTCCDFVTPADSEL